jgi:Carboxypeptidase regulatory-like domain
VVAGTVFRDPGFSQPGAAVVLALKSAPQKKLQQQTSDARGEFAFRVPPGPNTYIVTATLKGFKPAREEIEVLAVEQTNATLLLIPESK